MRPLIAPPDDHPPFAPLPVRFITPGSGAVRLAVYTSGVFDLERLPLVCLAGYHRNMTDFADFLRQFRSVGEADWPVVLIDLAGRGRSDWRPKKTAYSSISDAADVVGVMHALGLSRAVFAGQGHGGQVIQALGTHAASLVAGAILIDAGPIADPRGLVRLRNNFKQIEGFGRGVKAVQALSRMVAADYPTLAGPMHEKLALRTFFLDRRDRTRPLFDPRLMHQLETIAGDDILEPQWSLFTTLGASPLMLARTQHSDQLRRETFEEMLRQRPDAIGLMIANQGSPALLDAADEAGAIADFVTYAQDIQNRRWRVPTKAAPTPHVAE